MSESVIKTSIVLMLTIQIGRLPAQQLLLRRHRENLTQSLMPHVIIVMQ